MTRYSWKVLFGGAGGVGKTTFLHRFMHDEFLPDTQMTVGVQFNTTEMNKGEHEIGLSLWDLGGQERFRFIQEIYMEGAHAAAIFFDMSRIGTIGQVKNWVEMIREHAGENLPIVLVGTKNDLVENMDRKRIEAIAKQTVNDLGLISFTITSSKTGINVEEFMDYLVDILLLESRSRDNSINRDFSRP
ncbi:GTP-binding protein [Candidatus Bathyarchaeota archaeon]|nr:GTP-binding protein [Candidatus Bathyarchaeota archaeon]